MSVDESDTIKDIKAMVQDKTGIPTDRQHVIFQEGPQPKKRPQPTQSPYPKKQRTATEKELLDRLEALSQRLKAAGDKDDMLALPRVAPRRR